MEKIKELKPNKKVFLWYGLVKEILITFLIIGTLFTAIQLTEQYISLFTKIRISHAIILATIITAILIPNRFAKYKKEKYFIYKDKLIKKAGNLISDTEYELVIKNITNVICRLPFLKYKIFGTGQIIVESAGSGTSYLDFNALEKPFKLYSKTEGLMKNNGFSLDKSNKIHSEKPDKLGVTAEIIREFFVGLFSTLLLVSSFVSGIFVFFEEQTQIALTIAGSVLTVVLVIGVFRFLELIKRRYHVYEDIVYYEEGFLTRDNAFMPIQNLADASITQNLVERIIKVYDVVLSSQGNGRNIYFKNMKNGKKLQSSIDKLIEKHSSNVKTQKTSKKQQESTKESSSNEEKGYEINTLRSILPLLILMPLFLIFLPLMFIFVLLIGGKLVEAFATKYKIKKNGVEENFEFISSKKREFTKDKLTGVIIHENIVDKWLGTCSITFWSIGASKNIQFKYINKDKNIHKLATQKAGVEPKKEVYEMNPSFKVPEFFKANLYWMVFLTIFNAAAIYFTYLSGLLWLVPVLSVLGLMGILIHRTRVYARSYCKLYSNAIKHKYGIIFQRTYYTTYENVKDITILEYPASSRGEVTFNVAGEQVVGNQQQGQQAAVSNSFSVPYINEIEIKDNLVDYILEKKPSENKIKEKEEKLRNSETEEPLIKAKQDVSNTVAGIAIPFIIIFPLLLIAPFVIWYVKKKRYYIESNRTISREGIIFKSQKSIIFDKIDYLNTYTSFLNKTFKNGTITINTAGSSKPELTIKNISKYRDFDKKLKEMYEKR
ncbi:MAG: PH domain-containing protein [Candidatus Pacearchaeota archaeon]